MRDERFERLEALLEDAAKASVKAWDHATMMLELGSPDFHMIKKLAETATTACILLDGASRTARAMADGTVEGER